MQREMPAAKYSSGHIPDPAAQLHLEAAVPRHGFENIGVGFHAGFGAVQIHHMDPLRPGLPEGLRGSQGILRHPVGGGEIPLHQPHALAVLYVDSGENQHSGDQSFLTVAGPPF